MSKKITYPAGGWLPPGAHVQWERDDQGKDFATNWKGKIQAPGRGECVRVLSDRPFPNGFGPRYPVVRIDTGEFAGHEWYIGHCTTRVKPGERFEFGHVLAISDQGYNFNGTTGGWVELGEAPGGVPGSMASSHWFDKLLFKPLTVKVPDPTLKRGDKGLQVVKLTRYLKACGWLRSVHFRYTTDVYNGLQNFYKHHNIKWGPRNGEVGDHVFVALAHAATYCKKHHRKEGPYK